MQMLQQRDKIIFLYPNDHQVRYVRMNVPHRVPVTPSWYGDSVGHYEGDTLVIDTIGVKLGPFAMVDFYGTPYTQALHVVERYRLLDYEAAKEGLERDARENLRPATGADAGSAPDYLQLQRQALATPIYRRRRRRLHDALVGDHHLPPRGRGMAGSRLCREHAGIGARRKGRGSAHSEPGGFLNRLSLPPRRRGPQGGPGRDPRAAK